MVTVEAQKVQKNNKGFRTENYFENVVEGYLLGVRRNLFIHRSCKINQSSSMAVDNTD